MQFRLAVLVLAVGLTAAALARAQDWAPERRKDQFPKDSSYLVVPAPYSLPGLGAGIGLVAYETNAFGIYNQAYMIYLTGDDEGGIFGIQQIHLLPKRLLLDLQYGDLSKTRAQEFNFRGMNTSATDYVVLEGEYSWVETQLTLTTDDRRWSVYSDWYQAESNLDKIRDNAGNVIATFSTRQSAYQVENTYGGLMDLTDDRFDPRRGTRVQLSVTDFPRNAATQPDFYVTDVSASAYVPFGKLTTWAWNYLRSDAQMRSTGLTDPAAIAQQQGLACAPSDTRCQAGLAARVNNSLAANTNGTSDRLGGQRRLRAYPQSRFQGAHTEYLATELRINLTDEFTPFDYFFFKGIRTGLQLAPFAEIGTVSETQGTLWNRSRSDYGVGGRLITASGAVYRFDVAVGDEGTATTIITDYPW